MPLLTRLLLLSLFTVSTASPAQEPLFTIDALVTKILQHNPALQASQRSLELASAGVTTAGARTNPRLEWNAGRNHASTAPASQGNVNGFGISQFLENPALRSARLEGANSIERGSFQLVAVSRNEVVSQIKVRAFEYLLRKEEVLAASESLQLLEEIRTRVKVRVDTGETGKYELIKADTEIVSAKEKEQSARLQVEQAAITLNRLAAGQLPANWSLDANLSDPIALPALDALVQRALESNPELRVLQADVDRADARLKEAVASRWPGLELGYFQQREPDVRQNMLSLSIQVPLLDQRSGPRAEAIADRERARARLEGRRAELQQQLALASKAVDIARVRINALDAGAMRGAEAALRVAQAAYRFGERGILDVLDAQRVLRSVRADLLQARYQLQASSIELEFLAGLHAASAN